MTAPQAASPPADRALARWGYGALVGCVALATVAAVLAGGGPLFAIVPAALAAAAYGLVKAPLRWSASALLVLMLAVDDTNETSGQWRTPFAVLGDLVHNRLDLVTGVPGLSVTGMEALVLLLLLVSLHRRMTGAGVDAPNRVPAPDVMAGLLLASVAAVAFAVANGMLHGQAPAPWKIRNLLHPVLLFLLFDRAFRGPIDHALLGRIVVFSALARAVVALIVQRIAVAETGGRFLTATSHGDSVLFAAGAYLLIADLLERGDGRRLLRAALLLPVLLVAMHQNGRRLVWVMLALMGGVTYLMAPMRGWKRLLTRTALVAFPVIALYVGLGWNREGRIFGPVRTLRGVVDTSYDHSAYWREVENWNIAVSMRERTLLGLGLGGRYTEHMFNDDISSEYPEYREWPHNTVLGLLLLLGPFGFAAVWSPFAAALFFAFRAHRVASEKAHRVAAMACVGSVVACHVLAYGDTGAHYPQYKVFIALALAMAGKLAVATGAWPGRRTPAA